MTNQTEAGAVFDPAGYEREFDVMVREGLGIGLARLVVDAVREHDAAGRPAILLPTAAESLAAFRTERLRAAAAPHLAAVDAILDALPEHADVLSEAVDRDGADGARSVLRGIADDLVPRVAAALGVSLPASEGGADG